ncbi:MAG: hypothetical protein AAFM91_08545 [Pseudomonadota bacterium]
MSIDYGIEWAYGEFRISRLRGNEVVESWKSPRPVTDLTSLSEAMYEAAHHVDISRGGSVAIAYEDDLHTHEFLEVPPLSSKDLNRYLERHVEQHKPFAGDAAWRAHPVSRGKQHAGVLLHLMPKYIVDAVMRICEDFYLMPKLLVPLTEIMSEYVPKLDADPNHALLLIALFDDRTQMLLSSANGEILFVRELSYPWRPDTVERLTVDINRTVGYAKQRIGGDVTQAWLIGENVDTAKREMVGQIEVELGTDPIAAEPEFWMRQVAALPQNLPSNFIPVLARRSITSKTFMRAAVMMSAITVFTAVTFAGTVEWTMWHNDTDRQQLQHDISDLNDEFLHLTSEVELMNIEKTKLDILNIDAFNLPAIFLSHLSDLVPEGLVLTKAEVIRGEHSWDIVLQGKSVVSLGEVAPLLAEFQRRLAGEPWNTRIVVSWEKAWMAQLQQGLASQSGDVGFEIRGQFQ